MKKASYLLPILAGSAIGMLGLIAMVRKMKGGKKSTPLEQAAATIGEITEDAKEKIDETIREIKVRMGVAEPNRMRDLNQLVTDTKAKFDSAAAQIKCGLRKMKH